MESPLINFAAFLRFFLVFGHVRKVGVEAARCIVLAVLVGVVCPVSRAQTTHFSGAETVVPTGSLNQPEAITADASTVTA
jgi:hypothetical protein